MRTAETTLLVVGFILSAIWFWEAVTVGRGPISTYVAPLAFGSIIAGGILRSRRLRKEDGGGGH